MDRLALFEDISNVLKRMGLGFFANFRASHYLDVTNQFIASLVVKYENPKKKTPRECTTHFKINNDSYTLSIAQVSYGFPNGSMTNFQHSKRRISFGISLVVGNTTPGQLRLH